MSNRLNSWKVRSLSLAGRVTLAQSSLATIPSYVMQKMKISMSICDKIDSIYKNFVWGGADLERKPYLLSWDKLCLPKNQGGLDFRPAKVTNNANLMKLAWKLVQNKEELWVKVIRSKYGYGEDPLPSFKKHQSRNTVNFWSDNWIPGIHNLVDFAHSEVTEDMIDEQKMIDHLCSDEFGSSRPRRGCARSAGLLQMRLFLPMSSVLANLAIHLANDVQHAYTTVGNVKKKVENGRAACGSIIRDNNRNFIACFSANLAYGTITAAEFWGVLLSVDLTLSLGLESLHIEVDSLAAMKLCSQEGIECHSLKAIILAIKDMCGKLYNWNLNNQYREANSCADELANFGHSLMVGCHVFITLPSCILLCFHSDAIGTCHLRIVAS
ncbi:Putative ribonuclease H protein [Arachis hypogaea]|nr:Putative ribonuclease H protein [Arachis hypogaea]